MEIVGIINDDGSVTPSMTDEEARQLFEDMPWLTDQDFEEVPEAKYLVVEVSVVQ